MGDLMWAGPVLAGVTFLTIWWGHVLVRIVHYYFGTRPAPVIFLSGLLLLLGSTQTGSDVVSAALGIVGLTLLWDAFELHRQELRVRQGHAPLNPKVHRTAAGILAANLSATLTEEERRETCLSCGSNENTRFLCRRGPYCQVRDWEQYRAQEAASPTEG
ncbi:MAG TPA: DUF4491 family protein [Chloroflexia bacterium]|nr:DUF4491 family protein [Chloroflexia bacterium]